ncbi:hypothetical protein [Bacillus wiedmannii]|nr:hypothetical protein [Bacillus wiedmannii]
MDLSVYSHAEGTIAEIIRLVNTNELKKDLLEDVIKNCVDLEFVRGVLYFTKSFAEITGYEHILEECKILFKN